MNGFLCNTVLECTGPDCFIALRYWKGPIAKAMFDLAIRSQYVLARISPSQTHVGNQAGQVPGPSLIESDGLLWRIRGPSRRLPGIKPESTRIMQRNTGIP